MPNNLIWQHYLLLGRWQIVCFVKKRKKICISGKKKQSARQIICFVSTKTSKKIVKHYAKAFFIILHLSSGKHLWEYYWKCCCCCYLLVGKVRDISLKLINNYPIQWKSTHGIWMLNVIFLKVTKKPFSYGLMFLFLLFSFSWNLVKSSITRQLRIVWYGEM